MDRVTGEPIRFIISDRIKLLLFIKMSFTFFWIFRIYLGYYCNLNHYFVLEEEGKALF